MKIRFQNNAAVCEANKGESLLLACARGGIILSAPCGGRHQCGKCLVRILEGEVTGDVMDANGCVRACMAQPLTDLVIAFPENNVIVNTEVYSIDGDASSIKDRKIKRPLKAGVALDIGTTTISARLLDLDVSSEGKSGPSGREALILETVSELNDQRVFGADVMSRIGAARQGRTAELFAVINRQTERILRYFIERWGLKRIERLSVSGNTTMLHLFLNVDPSGMGELPFTPVFLDARSISGKDLSLSAEHVFILPSISAFIGGDITAGLAVLDILHAGGPSLLIDIGTNGEMALCHEGSILCCSTAAGPCFEGAEISCGMGGVSGAISGVALNAGNGESSVSVTTIGNVAPRGICGSGLIDAVAVMLEQGIFDETGLMENHPSGFSLAPGVSIINQDIRQFQLAKSAILSGIKILCKNRGLNPGDIKNVYVAGGFGFFINKKNAIAAGIFPQEFLDRLSVSGNLSLQGAEESLYGEDFHLKCSEIITACQVIDLSADPAFMDEFAENMMFTRLV